MKVLIAIVSFLEMIGGWYLLFLVLHMASSNTGNILQALLLSIGGVLLIKHSLEGIALIREGVI